MPICGSYRELLGASLLVFVRDIKPHRISLKIMIPLPLQIAFLDYNMKLISPQLLLKLAIFPKSEGIQHTWRQYLCLM